jgi:hypothetical protein
LKWESDVEEPLRIGMLAVASENSFLRKILGLDWLGSEVVPIFSKSCSSDMCFIGLLVLHVAWFWTSKQGELSPAFIISRGLPIWEGPYNCRGCADLVYLSENDLQIPILFELLKEEGKHTIVCLTSLLGGLSTTPSLIGALEKSRVEEASAAENMKNPLLFPKEGPGFPDPNDSVLVAPTKNDSDLVEHDCSNRFCF